MPTLGPEQHAVERIQAIMRPKVPVKSCSPTIPVITRTAIE